ncbi:MAG: MFS transporter [Dehalococcoidia bacterium]|nr:MAG: MFS transporter [Dehalococcoidia bacterium]
MTIWSPFAFRDYRMLWLGSTAYTLTAQLSVLVTAVWLFEETGSAARLALLGVVQLFVQIVALVWGGTLADQFDRKRLLAAVQAATLAVLTALAILAVTDVLTPWHIYAATAVLGITGVVSQPARGALTANVVPRTHLMHAVSADNITRQVGSVLAPLLFAAVAEYVGLTAAFVMAAVTAIPSVLMPLGIRADTRPAREAGVAVTGGPREVVRRAWEGFTFVRRHEFLPGLYMLDIGMTVFTFYRQVLPALAKGLFRGGAGAVGILTAANSLGSAAGSLVVVAFERYPKKGLLVVYATLGFSISVFFFGTASALWVGVLVILMMGGTDGVSVTMRETMVQLETPDAMRGRTVSLGYLAAVTANNVGTIWVGFLAANVGAARTMQLGGILSIAITLVVWRAVRGIRTYRYRTS